MIDPKTISRHPRTTLFKTCSKTYKKGLIYPAMAERNILRINNFRKCYRNHPRPNSALFPKDDRQHEITERDDYVSLPRAPDTGDQNV